MEAFATPEDLAVRLGVTLTADEQTRASRLLDLASDMIRRAARQKITAGTSTVTVTPTGGRLLMPERPVAGVTAISPQASFEIDGDYLAGLPVGQTFTLTYSHGWETIPDAIVAICLEVVTRVWVNPGNASQEAYGSERVTHGASTGLVLTDDERRAVRDVVRRGSQAVDIR